jgi:hypothetical protein
MESFSSIGWNEMPAPIGPDRPVRIADRHAQRL